MVRSSFVTILLTTSVVSSPLTNPIIQVHYRGGSIGSLGEEL